MQRFFILCLLLICGHPGFVQVRDQLRSFFAADSVRVTIDWPGNFDRHRETIITFYALPNGNTTEQTMGRLLRPGDDWHFDIQHIRAQTRYIRQQLQERNFVVIYLENSLRSWPAWKQRHPDFRKKIPAMLDSLRHLVPGRRNIVYLNGHSGGGSLIFGFLAGSRKIPSYIRRISFLDSDYGYDSSYYLLVRKWINHVRGAVLNVFAYNDSVALLNGKPFVSATGGTWYRSRLWLSHLQKDFGFEKKRDDSLILYETKAGSIQFYFRTNPERKIYHTVQVERNGFIHSILAGTPFESAGYRYYDQRAYEALIEAALEIVLETR